MVDSQNIEKEHSWIADLADSRNNPWKIIAIVSIISIGISVYLFFIDNIFGGGLFLLLPIVTVMLARKPAGKTTGKIDDSGIKANNASYRYKNLRSFSLLEDHLILKPKKGGTVQIPIEIGAAHTIRTVLSNKLEETDYEESLTEIASRFLGIR